ncbi:MAG: hypothetical protein JO299_18260 [Gammaproteobacteria bacterium]|nr:hypothetical protein [Gammaproteobacteria bacterium]
MLRIKTLQWRGALVVTAWIFAEATVQAGTWTPLTNQPTFLNPPSQCAQYPNANCAAPGNYSFGGVLAENLLTDGSVLFEVNAVDDNGNISFLEYKLSPDAFGSYVNGTWKQVASLPDAASTANPNGWGPFAFASAVLADGRVIYEGGEYTGLFQFLLTNRGAIYDPVADKWTSVPPPPFFVDLYPPRAVFAPNPIGDSASVVLADGTFMLADKMSRQAALLNLKTMTWTETGTGTKADLNDEEGWTLLPNGKVLTVDCYTDFHFHLAPSYPTDPTNSEIYDPQTGQWSSAGSTINTLTDPLLAEMGPAVLRPDGTVFAVGDPGNTAIYHVRSGKWSVGPHLPMSPQGFQYTAQDASGALLPNGNVLFSVSGGAEPPGGGYSGPPLAFFEFDGHRLIPEPTIPDGPILTSSSAALLVLPTGQVIAADTNTDVEIYTPDRHDEEQEHEHEHEWAPIVLWGPRAVHPGKSYELQGIRFNGMSQASMFGDEGQNATNYPLVRITNLHTHHVFYSRTHDHSSMAVASDDIVSTHFDVPANQESGPSKLEVVANGIASEPLMILVKSDESD